MKHEKTIIRGRAIRPQRGDAGWLVDLEGEIPLIKCPVCKEIEDDD